MMTTGLEQNSSWSVMLPFELFSTQRVADSGGMLDRVGPCEQVRECWG